MFINLMEGRFNRRHFSFKGEGYLWLKLKWKDNFHYIVYVYSACSISKKVKSWRKIQELNMKFVDGDWVVRGDFNSIARSS